MTLAIRHPATCECVRCCDDDAARQTRPDEHRITLARMTEWERAITCTHQRRPHGTCIDCGDHIDWEEA